jgi:hypothetical protein
VTTAPPPTAAKLLAELRRAGINLTAVGDRLMYDAPTGSLTPALRAAIAEHRNQIMQELLAQEVSRQLDALVPHSGDDGPPRMIHRDLLRPERASDREMVDLASWALNRTPPPPTRPPPPPYVPRVACLAAARAAGWPSIEIRPGVRVVGTADAWRRFTERSFAPDVIIALQALQKKH